MATEPITAIEPFRGTRTLVVLELLCGDLGCAMLPLLSLEL